MTFTNQTKNQKFIHALLKGQAIQYRGRGDDKWYDFDTNCYLENEDPFGPWHCADCCEWRIKPNKTEVAFTFEKVITETVLFEFEGVKEDFYKKGETVFFIVKSPSGKFYKQIIEKAGNDQICKFEDYIFFVSEECLEKSWQQIPENMKGN